MILLNIFSVEDFFFKNKELVEFFPDLHHIYDQWLFSQRIPFLKSVRTQACVDLLDNLTSEHLKKLEELFDEPILLDKIDSHLVKSIDCELAKAELVINYSELYDNITAYRDETTLFITSWR